MQWHQIEALVMPNGSDDDISGKAIESEAQALTRDAGDQWNQVISKRSWNNLHGSWGKRANGDEANDIPETSDDLLLLINQPYRFNPDEANPASDADIAERKPEEFSAPMSTNKRSLQHIRSYFRKRFNDRNDGERGTCFFLRRLSERN